jgi:ATP-dependent DNA ligase
VLSCLRPPLLAFLTLDGWRMEAVKTRGKVTLYSRRAKVFNTQFGSIASALRDLADDRVIDGEVVALDEEGRPNFSLLQNFRSAGANVVYFVFDVMIHGGHDLMRSPLAERRNILRSIISSEGQIAISESSDRPLDEMAKFIRSHGLEGIVAKRADSQYQPGLRTGMWCKHRFNRSQEFVVGGYVPSPLGVDSLVIGIYKGKELRCTGASRIHPRHSSTGV